MGPELSPGVKRKNPDVLAAFANADNDRGRPAGQLTLQESTPSSSKLGSCPSPTLDRGGSQMDKLSVERFRAIEQTWGNGFEEVLAPIRSLPAAARDVPFSAFRPHFRSSTSPHKLLSENLALELVYGERRPLIRRLEADLRYIKRRGLALDQFRDQLRAPKLWGLLYEAYADARILRAFKDVELKPPGAGRKICDFRVSEQGQSVYGEVKFQSKGSWTSLEVERALSDAVRGDFGYQVGLKGALTSANVPHAAKTIELSWSYLNRVPEQFGRLRFRVLGPRLPESDPVSDVEPREPRSAFQGHEESDGYLVKVTGDPYVVNVLLLPGRPQDRFVTQSFEDWDSRQHELPRLTKAYHLAIQDAATQLPTDQPGVVVLGTDGAHLEDIGGAVCGGPFSGGLGPWQDIERISGVVWVDLAGPRGTWHCFRQAYRNSAFFTNPMAPNPLQPRVAMRLARAFGTRPLLCARRSQRPQD